MKEIFKISIIILILGCNHSKIDNPIPKETTPVTNDTVNKHDDSTNYLKRVAPSNGKFALKDLSSKFCLVFGIGKDEPNNYWNTINADSLKGYIIDPTYKEFSNLRELRTQIIHAYPNYDSLPICQFENSLLIPFKSDEDSHHLTVWKIISKDSIQFDKTIQPSIQRRYTNITSINQVELKNKNYLSIYLKGCEGGSDWDELIIAEYNGNNKFEIIANESVVHCHDCGDWAKIQLKTDTNGFELTEIRDSMRLINNHWKRKWRKIKQLRTVKI